MVGIKRRELKLVFENICQGNYLGEIKWDNPGRTKDGPGKGCIRMVTDTLLEI